MNNRAERLLAAALQDAVPDPPEPVTIERIRQRRRARARTRVTVTAACVAVVAVAAVVLAVQTVGHGGESSAISVASWRTDTEDHGSGTMSIRYPPSWRVRHFSVEGSFTSGIVAFSNGPFTSPCRGNPHVSIECQGLPHAQLEPGGLVAMWYASAFPGMTGSQLLDRSPGRRTTVDHHPAKLAIGRASATCSADGGTTSIQANIVDTGGLLTMEACVNDSRATINQIEASVWSLRLNRHH